MLKSIIRKEILNNLFSYKFSIIIILSTILILVSIFVMYRDYRNRFNRLVKVSQNITRISPAAAFTFLATDITGTGMSEERNLKRAVLEYMDIIEDWDNDKGARPVFSYKSSSYREALGPGGLSNCLILILFNILFIAGAYVAFLRYDVR